MQTIVRNTERQGRRVVRPVPEDGLPPAKITLLAIGLEPPQLFRSSRPVLVLPELREGQACEQVLDLAASRTAQGEYLVVLYPAWLPPAEQARLLRLRASLRSSRFVLVPTALPPLAASTLVAAAAAAARRLPHPGSLVAALPTLAGRLIAVTWLGSVARLRRPRPPLSLRLASVFPGGGFLATTTAAADGLTQRWTRASGEKTSVPLPTLLQPNGLVIAGKADGGRVQQWLGTALGHPPVTAVEVPKRSDAHWGVTRVVEAVAYPLAIEDLAARLARRQGERRCGWCGEVVACRLCPFCRMAVPTGDWEVDR